MPEYVLKILFRFTDRDDVEARDGMHAILSDIGGLNPPCEFTLRRLGAKGGKVVSNGTLPPGRVSAEKPDVGGN